MITFDSSSKEKWEGFNQLGTYEDYNRCGVVPFLDDTGKELFDMVKVCIDRDGILGGVHLNECKFDDQFKDGVVRDIDTKDIESNNRK